MSDNTAPQILKPVFVPWITMVVAIPLQLFLSFWVAGFFGGMLSLDMNGKIGLFAGAVLVIGVLCYFGKKLNYANTRYLVFDDRVELEEGFFTIQKKTVDYAHVREVVLRQGILQRTAKLGSVYMATQATGSGANSVFPALGFRSASNAGFTALDLTNAPEVYDLLRARTKPR